MKLILVDKSRNSVVSVEVKLSAPTSGKAPPDQPPAVMTSVAPLEWDVLPFPAPQASRRMRTSERASSRRDWEPAKETVLLN